MIFPIRLSGRDGAERLGSRSSRRTVPCGLRVGFRERIALIVEEKADWIRKRLRSAIWRGTSPSENFADGEEFPFLGAMYRLERVAGLKGIAIMGDRLCVGIGGRRAQESEEPRRIAARITRWYRLHAAGIITGRVDHFSEHLGLKPSAVRLKTLKSRGGSCSSRGNLNFNWLLVLAPIHILDYVVVHELCHLCTPIIRPILGHGGVILPIIVKGGNGCDYRRGASRSLTGTPGSGCYTCMSRHPVLTIGSKIIHHICRKRSDPE